MFGIISMKEWLFYVQINSLLTTATMLRTWKEVPWIKIPSLFMSSSNASPYSILPCIPLCVATLFTGMLVVINL